MAFAKKQTQHPMDSFEEHYKLLYYETRRRHIDGIDFEHVTEEELKVVLQFFLEDYIKILRAFVFCRTYEGHLGLVPHNAQPNDWISVIHGCSVPFILRESTEGKVFSVIGSSFVYGIMKGQTLEAQNKPTTESLTLI
jgi:hypothetical protein